MPTLEQILSSAQGEEIYEEEDEWEFEPSEEYGYETERGEIWAGVKRITGLSAGR